MGRGLISGLIWGAFLSICAAGLISLSAPLPERMMPAAVDNDMPEAADEDEAADTGQMPVEGEADLQPTPDETVPIAVETESAANTTPVSTIPLPAGSEFNRPPEEQDPTVPNVDRAPAVSPQAITSLPAPVSPPLPDTAPAPQPIATASLQGPSGGEETSTASTPEITTEAAAPVSDTDPAPLGLPQIETGPVAETDTPPAGRPLQLLTDEGGTEVETEMPEDLPAIEAFAADFDASETRPLMAIILIDDGDFPLGRSALTRFEFPVAFAIDPTREDASEAAQEYRDAGFEVLFLADPLAGADTAEEVSARIETGLQTLPESVAILDNSIGVIQSNRTILDAVVAYSAESGHGLLAYPRGLNVAEQSADRADVPAATLFREIDTERERATVITRYLDRAAFAAGQEGAVVVVGHTYSDTVTALFSWALGSRSEGVALAPVSAVLTR